MNPMAYDGTRDKQRGFSLAELLVALAIMSLISLALGSIFIEQMKTMKNIDLIVAVENDFNTMSKTVRTPVEVARHLGLKVDVSGEWVDNPTPNALALCIQGHGTACQSNFNAWTALPDPTDFLNSQGHRSGPCVAPTPCEYERITQYRAECDAVRCYSISFLTRVVPRNASSFRERRAEIRLSANLILNRRDINFTCGGASGYVTAVDFKNLRALCGPVGGGGTLTPPTQLSNSLYPLQPGHTSCPGGAPSCKAVIAAERSCSDGFTSVSLFDATCI